MVSKEVQTENVEAKKKECLDIIEREMGNSSKERCETVWDQMVCWPSTPAGTTVTMRCPEYINSFIYDANATKRCESDGSWYISPASMNHWTNYTQCIKPPQISGINSYKSHLEPLRFISLVGYSLSLVALLMAILIMLKFKKLRCARNTLHLNLFASFVWRAVAFLSRSFMFVDGSPLIDSLVFGNSTKESTWHCRLFAVIFNYGTSSNYSWIFVEGFYLHTLIFVAFFSETSGVYGFVIFGWTFPLVFVLAWAVVKATFENVHCWLTHANKWSAWIIKGPLLITNLLNFFFFVNIVRVLFTKLQTATNIDSRRHRHMKLAKSSLVLIPLFGVPYVIFLALNENVCPTMELIKLYFEMIFNSFNGLIVACLYCFFNGEVKSELAKKWRKAKLRPNLRSLSQKKTTMTRSLNSNAHDIGHSHTYDTTAINDDGEAGEDEDEDEEEGWLASKRVAGLFESSGLRQLVKKSNSMEMKVISDFSSFGGGLGRGRSEDLSNVEVEEPTEKDFISDAKRAGGCGNAGANETATGEVRLDEENNVLDHLIPKIFENEERQFTGYKPSRNRKWKFDGGEEEKEKIKGQELAAAAVAADVKTGVETIAFSDETNLANAKDDLPPGDVTFDQESPRII